MAYDTDLEQRIDAALEVFPEEIRTNISKKKMFGGLAFLLQGKMTVGINGTDLMARVVSEKMDDALSKADVRPMDFTNRPMKEFVFVSPQGYQTGEQLQHWIELGIEHAKTKLANN